MTKVQYVIVIRGSTKFGTIKDLYPAIKEVAEISGFQLTPHFSNALFYGSNASAKDALISNTKYWIKEAEYEHDLSVSEIKIYKQVSNYIEVL